MTRYDTLLERQVREYEARRKRFDELLAQAEQKISASPDNTSLSDELISVRQEREKLLQRIAQMKQKTHEEWQEETIEEAGPMFLWEAVAKRLESLVERLERKKEASVA